MLDVEERICQKIAKEFNLSPAEVRTIHRSQYRQITKTMRAFEGYAFALPYIGEFSVIPKMERYLEVCRINNKVENTDEY